MRIVLALVAFAGSSIARSLQSVSELASQDIPATCTSQCSEIQSTLASCLETDITCVCTEAFNAGLLTCINCLVGIFSGTQDTVNTIQGDMNQFVTNCKANGITITQYKIGQTPSGAAATNTGTSGTRRTLSVNARELTNIICFALGTTIYVIYAKFLS